MTRVAIVGGGMAGLATAWHLTRPDGDHPEVTVYQRGARLGGKGASSRGENGRIEEHGLHLWLGHYDNAFRMLRSVYEELDRPTTRPSCPIRTCEQGFQPANLVGLGERDDEGWHNWVARFPSDDRTPGEVDHDGSMTPAEWIGRVVQLIGRLGASMQPLAPVPRAVLSTRSGRPERRPPAGFGAAEAIRGTIRGFNGARGDIHSERRSRQFIDFLVAFLRGAIADDITFRGYGSLDDEDLADWLRRHGVSDETLSGPFVQGLYDLAFAYLDGDPAKPTFPAGLGLYLAGRSFVDYKGALFYKMRAGMGEVVIAPMYELLRRRGVRFEFFHRLDEVHLDPTGTSVAGLTFGRQLDLAPGVDQYDPLVVQGGLPVFPHRIDLAQVTAGPEVHDHDLESHGCRWTDAGATHIEGGRDFDTAVLAVSIGMVPHTCGQLLAADQRWVDMVEHVKTCATHSFQLWLDHDEKALGWEHPPASVTGVGVPFDTFASMSQTLVHEGWPEGSRPLTAGYFCAAMPEELVPATDDPDHDEKAKEAVRAAAVRFLDDHGPDLWPGTAAPEGGFRWDLLTAPDGLVGSDRFLAQHWQANTDPSDRYVQATPGSSRYRLRADEAGFERLVLAGDWIDNGMNAGCIEAAVVSGIEAANVVAGAPITEGVSCYEPQNPVAGQRGPVPDPNEETR